MVDKPRSPCRQADEPSPQPGTRSGIPMAHASTDKGWRDLNQAASAPAMATFPAHRARPAGGWICRPGISAYAY